MSTVIRRNRAFLGASGRASADPPGNGTSPHSTGVRGVLPNGRKRRLRPARADPPDFGRRDGPPDPEAVHGGTTRRTNRAMFGSGAPGAGGLSTPRPRGRSPRQNESRWARGGQAERAWPSKRQCAVGTGGRTNQPDPAFESAMFRSGVPGGRRRGRGIPSARSSGGVAHALTTAPLILLGTGTVDKAWTTPSRAVPSIPRGRFPCRRGVGSHVAKNGHVPSLAGSYETNWIRPLNRAMFGSGHRAPVAYPRLVHGDDPQAKRVAVGEGWISRTGIAIGHDNVPSRPGSCEPTRPGL